MAYATRCFALLIVCTSAAAPSPQKPPTPSVQQRTSQKPAASDSASQLGHLSKELELLKTENVSLRAKLQRLESTQTQLLIRLNSLESRNKAVTLDPATPRKYQRLDCDSGFFLVSLLDVTPYLDGYKVKIHVGNPAAATYVGFKLTTKWGPRFDWEKFSPASYDSWQKAQQNKEFSFADRLAPGAWNPIELILPATSASQIGFVELSIDTDTISLAGVRQN